MRGKIMNKNTKKKEEEKYQMRNIHKQKTFMHTINKENECWKRQRERETKKTR